MTAIELKAAIDAWVETYIHQTIAYRNGQIPTAAEFNTIFNLLIQQGDSASEAIGHIRDFLTQYMLDVDASTTTKANDAAELYHQQYIAAWEESMNVTLTNKIADMQQAKVDEVAVMETAKTNEIAVMEQAKTDEIAVMELAKTNQINAMATANTNLINDYTTQFDNEYNWQVDKWNTKYNSMVSNWNADLVNHNLQWDNKYAAYVSQFDTEFTAQKTKYDDEYDVLINRWNNEYQAEQQSFNMLYTQTVDSFDTKSTELDTQFADKYATLESTYATNLTDIKALQATMDAQLDAVAAAATVDSELILARTSATKGKVYTTTGNRLEAIEQDALKQTGLDANAVQQTGTGTSIQLLDTVDNRLLSDIKIEGASQQTITTQGKNLLDINKVTLVSVSATITKITNGVNVTSKLSETYTFGYMEIKLSPNTSYVIKANSVSITSGDAIVSVRDESDTVIYTQEGYAAVQYVCKFTTTASGIVRVRLYATSNVAAIGNINFTNIQIELGSAATAYEAFAPNSPSPDYPSAITNVGDTAYDVVSCGKNLFSGFPNKTSNGITMTQNADGTITLNGTASADFNSDTMTFSNKFSEGIIASATRISGTNTTDLTLYNWNTTYGDGRNAVLTSSGTTSSSTKSTGDRKLRIGVLAGCVCNNLIIGVQVEASTVANTYEANKSNKLTFSQLLPATPSAKNTIEKVNGVWNYVQRVGKTVLNGTENWDLAQTNTGTIRLSLNISNSVVALIKKVDTSIGTNILCSNFSVVSQATLANDSEGISPHASAGLQIRINKSRLTTQDAAGLKTWLTSNNVTVYYELATYIYTPLSDLNLTTYQALTNVYTTASVQPTLTVTALKDINSKFTYSPVTHNYSASVVDWILSNDAQKSRVLVCTNAGANANVILPANWKEPYTIKNNSGYTITAKTSTSTGVQIPSGETETVVFIDTDYFRIVNDYTAELGVHTKAIDDARKTYSNALQQVGTGTAVNLTNTLNVPLIDVKIEGASQQTVTVQGKNLLPKFRNETKNGVTSTIAADGTITLNGTASADTYFYPFSFNKVADGNYTLSLNNPVAISGVSIRVLDTVPSVRLSAATSGINSIASASITNESNIDLKVVSGTVLSNLVIKPQLESGTIATAYEAYVPNSPSPDYPAPITNAGDCAFDLVSCGKNLFSMTVDASPTTQYNPVIQGYVNILIGRTYTISYNTENTGIVCYVNSVCGLPETIFTCDGTKKTFTLVATSTKLYGDRIVISRSSVTSGIATGHITNLQIEAGSATTYEAYKANKVTLSNLLPALPNGTKNTIEKINGVWNYVQRVGKIVLNGTETGWGNIGTDTKTIRIKHPVSSLNIKSATTLTVACVISDKFNGVPNTSWGNDTEQTETDSVYLSIRINKSRLTTVDVAGFKTWLASNNVTVYYELATLVYIPIPDLYLTSYPSITNIFTTASVQPNLTVTAVKDINAQFPATNLITNGNFKDGVISTGTVTTRATATLDNTNALDGNSSMKLALSDAVNFIGYYDISILPLLNKNHVHYWSGYVKNGTLSSTGIRLGITTNAGSSLGAATLSTSWVRQSGILSTSILSTATVANFDVCITGTAIGQYGWFDMLSIIDLTETFGAGNEPTQTEMDAMMAYFPNSWFDGTVNLADYKWLMTYLLKRVRSIEARLTAHGI